MHQSTARVLRRHSLAFALKRPAVTQQVLALAHFSDGTVRDVTPLAVFSSSDDAVATVDTAGLVTAQDRGETAILVRFLEKVEIASLTFLKEIDDSLATV